MIDPKKTKQSRKMIQLIASHLSHNPHKKMSMAPGKCNPSTGEADMGGSYKPGPGSVRNSVSKYKMEHN